MFLRECTRRVIVAAFVAGNQIARVEPVCEQTERQRQLPGNETPIAGIRDIRLPGNETLFTGKRNT